MPNRPSFFVVLTVLASLVLPGDEPLRPALEVLASSPRIAIVPVASPVAPASQLWGFTEGEDSIEELLLHFDRTVVGDMFPVYRDLARALAPETGILMAVPSAEDRGAAEFVLTQAGFAKGRCKFLVTGTELSVWARDRLITLATPAGPLFFSPNSEQVESHQDGDLAVGPLLANARGGTARYHLFVEGGNVVCGAGHVFTGWNSIGENKGVGDDEVVSAALHELFGVAPVILGLEGKAPPHVHVDMYLSAIGPDRVLLGDPSAGAEFVRQVMHFGVDASLLSDHSLSVELQLVQVPAYERIRSQLLAAGLRVERVPIVHLDSDQTVLTWNNALLERRADGLRAYVPSYGIPVLDAAALDTYRRLGYRAFPIDVSRLAKLGGTVRCVTNVLRWRRAAPLR